MPRRKNILILVFLKLRFLKVLILYYVFIIINVKKYSSRDLYKLAKTIEVGCLISINQSKP
jgi:hypothetical protein